MTIHLSLMCVILIIICMYALIWIISYGLCCKRKMIAALMYGVVAFSILTLFIAVTIMNRETTFDNIIISKMTEINDDNMYVCEDGTEYVLSPWNSLVIDGYSVKINNKDYESCKVTALCKNCYHLGAIDVVITSTNTCLYMDEASYVEIYRTNNDK